jgi:hypothetical protein
MLQHMCILHRVYTWFGAPKHLFFYSFGTWDKVQLTLTIIGYSSISMHLLLLPRSIHHWPPTLAYPCFFTSGYVLELKYPNFAITKHHLFPISPLIWLTKVYSFGSHSICYQGLLGSRSIYQPSLPNLSMPVNCTLIYFYALLFQPFFNIFSTLFTLFKLVSDISVVVFG